MKIHFRPLWRIVNDDSMKNKSILSNLNLHNFSCSRYANYARCNRQSIDKKNSSEQKRRRTKQLWNLVNAYYTLKWILIVFYRAISSRIHLLSIAFKLMHSFPVISLATNLIMMQLKAELLELFWRMESNPTKSKQYLNKKKLNFSHSVLKFNPFYIALLHWCCER